MTSHVHEFEPREGGAIRAAERGASRGQRAGLAAVLKRLRHLSRPPEHTVGAQ